MSQKTKRILFISISLIILFYLFGGLDSPSDIEPDTPYITGSESLRLISADEIKVLESVLHDPEKNLPSAPPSMSFTTHQQRSTNDHLTQDFKNSELIMANYSNDKNIFPELPWKVFLGGYQRTGDLKRIDFCMKTFGEYVESNSSKKLGWKAIHLLEMINAFEQEGVDVAPSHFMNMMAKVTLELKEKLANLSGPEDFGKALYASTIYPKSPLSDSLWEKASLNLISPDLKTPSSSKASADFFIDVVSALWFRWLRKESFSIELLALCEREAVRLAYRLEPDGCLPQIDGVVERVNLREHLFKASQMIDRDDIRFVAYGGVKMTDAYPPQKEDVFFPELETTIFRSNWVISNYDRFKGSSYTTKGCTQISWCVESGELSAYASHRSMFVMKGDHLRSNKTPLLTREGDLVTLRTDKFIIKLNSAKDSLAFKILSDDSNTKMNLYRTSVKKTKNNQCGTFFPKESRFFNNFIVMRQQGHFDLQTDKEITLKEDKTPILKGCFYEIETMSRQFNFTFLGIREEISNPL